MKCPHCKKEILIVTVISECWQKADVNENGRIVEYGSVEEVLETVKVECRNCFGDITDIIEDK